MSSINSQKETVVMKNESNPLFESIPPERCIHIEDLNDLPISIENNVYNYVPLLIPPLRYSNYLNRVFEYLSYTLLFNITMQIVQPLNFFILYILFPIGAIILIVLDVILRAITLLGSDLSRGTVKEWVDITETKIGRYHKLKSLNVSNNYIQLFFDVFLLFI